MPQITITASTNAAQRLIDALSFEDPSIVNLTAQEKAEKVRQKIISLLRFWCLNNERAKANMEFQNQLTNDPPDLT